MIWERLPVVIERPLSGRISFGGYIHRGGYGPRQVDCVVVTDDLKRNVAELDMAALARLPGADSVQVAAPAVAGFVPGGGSRLWTPSPALPTRTSSSTPG